MSKVIKKKIKYFDSDGLFLFECVNLRGYIENAKTIEGAHCNMRRICFSNECFSGASLYFIDFSFSGVSKVCFYWAIIHDCIFVESSLVECDFRGATLSKINFSKSIFLSSVFSCANIGSAASFRNCLFNEAVLTKCDFRGAMLDGCDFSGSNINLSDFGPGSKGSLTSVCGVDFRAAKIFNSNFEGIVYDVNTKWPEKFILPSSARFRES